MADIRQEAANVRSKYKTLQQQQFIFVNALYRSRNGAYEKSKPLRTINEVKELHDRSKNSTDKRSMRQWLDLLTDLDNLRKRIETNYQNVIKEGSGNRAAQRLRVLLNPSHDFSGLVAKFPHTEINHLSCEEARILFGGCVSLVPFIFDQVTRIQGEIAKKTNESLQETWPLKKSRERVVQSARHVRAATEECDMTPRAKTAIGQRDQKVDTKDLTKHMMKLSMVKFPKGADEKCLFYRRTLNGRADKLKYQ